MNYQMMQLDEMNPSPYNPRKTLKPGEQKYEALKESISRFDLVEPIIVNQKTGNIVVAISATTCLEIWGSPAPWLLSLIWMKTKRGCSM